MFADIYKPNTGESGLPREYLYGMESFCCVQSLSMATSPQGETITHGKERLFGTMQLGVKIVRRQAMFVRSRSTLFLSSRQILKFFLRRAVLSLPYLDCTVQNNVKRHLAGFGLGAMSACNEKVAGYLRT